MTAPHAAHTLRSGRTVGSSGGHALIPLGGTFRDRFYACNVIAKQRWDDRVPLECPLAGLPSSSGSFTRNSLPCEKQTTSFSGPSSPCYVLFNCQIQSSDGPDRLLFVLGQRGMSPNDSGTCKITPDQQASTACLVLLPRQVRPPNAAAGATPDPSAMGAYGAAVHTAQYDTFSASPARCSAGCCVIDDGLLAELEVVP